MKADVVHLRIDRPAAVIIVELEKSDPEVILTGSADDQARLADWLISQPGLRDVVVAAFEADGTLDEIRAEDERSA